MARRLFLDAARLSPAFVRSPPRRGACPAAGAVEPSIQPLRSLDCPDREPPLKEVRIAAAVQGFEADACRFTNGSNSTGGRSLDNGHLVSRDVPDPAEARHQARGTRSPCSGAFRVEVPEEARFVGVVPGSGRRWFRLSEPTVL